jgi:cytochrome P450
MPPVVVATSPQGGRDILGRSGEHVERTRVHHEMRHLLGSNLFDLTHEPWLPRRRALQPIFTKQRVHEFGGHMAQAAQTVADRWVDGTEVDLDTECRRLTLRALGRSVLGLDLDDHSDTIAEPLRMAVEYVTDRALRPINPPRWMPTPARQRARTASDTVHRFAGEILQACRADPSRDAPLVQALIAARDPGTGRALCDNEIRDELTAFMLAGHDTTATTLTYALWALGHQRGMQDKVRAEAVAIGDRELTPEDVAALGYTVQVLHEALRLCPPAAVTGRMALRDIEVDGYRVEAGTVLVVGIYAPASRRRPVGPPTGLRPRPIQPKKLRRPRPLAIPTLRRRTTLLHRRPLRHTRSHARAGHHHPAHRNPVYRRRFPMIVPFTTVAAAPIRAHLRLRI